MLLIQVDAFDPQVDKNRERFIGCICMSGTE